ncbi:MAG: M23 family metallopeptidase [Candidatus Alcyoniella australis]|nr:M23 family metallopeptidase [Candidatus Alcyoniella australis]
MRTIRALWICSAMLLLAALALACGSTFGVYHTVQRGQTLYSIAKSYNIPMDELVRLNRIKDPDKIQAGQKLFIPGTLEHRSVKPTCGPNISNPATTPRPNVTSDPSAQVSRPDGANPFVEEGKPAPDLTTFGPGCGLKLIWPVNGTIYSRFGMRGSRFHEGVDIAAPEGTAIVAAEEGTVVYEGSKFAGYGKIVVIKHACNAVTVYAHNQRNLVSEGDRVRKGQLIARVGQTGRASGPHCHFEVRINRVPANPENFLPKR